MISSAVMVSCHSDLKRGLGAVLVLPRHSASGVRGKPMLNFNFWRTNNSIHEQDVFTRAMDVFSVSSVYVELSGVSCVTNLLLDKEGTCWV